MRFTERANYKVSVIVNVGELNGLADTSNVKISIPISVKELCKETKTTLTHSFKWTGRLV